MLFDSELVVGCLAAYTALALVAVDLVQFGAEMSQQLEGIGRFVA